MMYSIEEAEAYVLSKNIHLDSAEGIELWLFAHMPPQHHAQVMLGHVEARALDTACNDFLAQRVLAALHTPAQAEEDDV